MYLTLIHLLDICLDCGYTVTFAYASMIDVVPTARSSNFLVEDLTVNIEIDSICKSNLSCKHRNRPDILYCLN